MSEKYTFTCETCLINALEDYQCACSFEDITLENLIHYIYDNEYALLQKVIEEKEAREF